MRSLADLQASLARRLTGDPREEDDPSISRALRSLQHKRMTAAAQLLPNLQTVLGKRWTETFAAHASAYTPCGLLYHVDDAFEFASVLSHGPARKLRDAARRDLALLRLRWQRGSARDVNRVRERDGLCVVWSVRPLFIAIRLPGHRRAMIPFGTLLQ
jgi:hypothetical protein